MFSETGGAGKFFCSSALAGCAADICAVVCCAMVAGDGVGGGIAVREVRIDENGEPDVEAEAAPCWYC